jgi:hypothetical protein
MLQVEATGIGGGKEEAEEEELSSSLKFVSLLRLCI